MVAASAGSGLFVRSESATRVYKKWSDEVRRDLRRHSAECRRAGMSCFGAGCRTRGASLAGMTSALPPRSGTDNARGIPPNPRLDGKRAAGEMRCGRSRGRWLCRRGVGWRAVSDTSRQLGGDNLGVAVEEQDGQRTGDAPEPPIGWQAGGR